MRYKTREDMVEEFHSPIGAVDNEWTREVLDLRYKLIREETEELLKEINKFRARSSEASKEALLKELCDLQYVLSGTAVQLGLPLQQGFLRVHESNMSKYVDGYALRREDGKVLKGPNYSPPVLSNLFKEV